MSRKPELTWDGAKVAERTRDAAIQGLTSGAGLILGTARARTPTDTGELVNSSDVSVDAEQGVASVHYGTDHAVVVHEKTTLHHPRGQAKFLESALKTDGNAALQAIADMVRKSLQ